MSPRPMRTYRAPILVCYLCLKPITGETRMLDGCLYHPLCASRAEAQRRAQA